MSKMDILFSIIFAYPIWQTFFFIKEGQMGLLDSKKKYEILIDICAGASKYHACQKISGQIESQGV